MRARRGLRLFPFGRRIFEAGGAGIGRIVLLPILPGRRVLDKWARKGRVMRRWGVAISVVYAVILVGLLVPLGVGLFGAKNVSELFEGIIGTWAEVWVWIPLVMLLGGQAALLFVPVDTSPQRLRPRAPVVRSAVAAGMLLMVLTVAAVCSVGVGIYADKFLDKLPDASWFLLGTPLAIWAAWGVVFYLYLREKTDVTPRVMKWLLRGSVLELLVAVPCHVIVRKRDDCCAPAVTSFGITAGIAIMLLSFGPSVLLLYKKRMDAYRPKSAPHAAV